MGLADGLYSTLKIETRLKQSEANQIRELYATGCHTQVELAERFDVSQSTISRVVRNLHYVEFSETKIRKK